MGSQKGRRRQHQVKRPPKLCVYCSKRGAVKMDHVIARVFFDALPSRAITVPSCNECDNGRGDGGPHGLNLDEDEFANVLCMRHDAADHPVAKKLLDERVFRSLDHTPKKLMRIMEPVIRWKKLNDAGFHIAEDYTYNVKGAVIARVLRKIVRGLYFYESRTPLPPDSVIRLCPDAPMDAIDEFSPMFGAPRNVWAGDEHFVFLYKGGRSRETP